MEFKDRISQNQNRRKLKIVSQTADEIIADVELADTNVLEVGTAINAEKMNEIRINAETAKTNSLQALEISNLANGISETANTKSDTALANSQTAITTSNSADTKATQALAHVIQMQGTTVYVNDTYVTTFNADLKADKSVVDSELTLLKNRATALETKPIISNVTYDATTNTFIF